MFQSGLCTLTEEEEEEEEWVAEIKAGGSSGWEGDLGAILTHICCKIEQISKNKMKSIKQSAIAH